MFKNPSIYDDYFRVVETTAGKVRFGGTERGTDELPREVFAAQLTDRPVMYGEWRQKFGANGDDFNVEIISFGYPSSYSVAGEAGKESFARTEMAAIEELVAALFASADAKSQLAAFSPYRRGAFLGKIRFLPGWIRTPSNVGPVGTGKCRLHRTPRAIGLPLAGGSDGRCTRPCVEFPFAPAERKKSRDSCRAALAGV